MRLAWIVHGALEQPTGGYLYDAQLVSRLRERGHDVGVWSIEPAEPHAALRLAHRLAFSQVDVVVIDELCHREAAMALALRRLFGWRRSRCVLLVHHLAEWEDDRSRTSEWLCLRLADVVICTSRTSSLRLARSFGIDAPVCPPGCDRLPLAPRRAEVGRPVSLLFVGTVTPRKQLVALIEALDRLRTHDYRLTVAGDVTRDVRYLCAVQAALSAAPTVAQRTTLLGVVDDSRLSALYAASDVLVAPSSFEGYGMAIAEAVHAGLPVVAARAGAVPEVVREGEEARLFPPGDVEALVHALEAVLGDPSLRARMGEFAARRCLPRWQETFEQFERLLMESREGR